MKHENAARMLLSFYNMQVGTRFRLSNWGEDFDRIIANDESNVSEIRSAIKEWATNPVDGAGESIKRFIDWYRYEKMAEMAEKKAEPAQVEPVASSPAVDLNLGIKVIADTVANMVSAMKTEEIQKTVVDSLSARVDEYILNTYGKIEKSVTLVSEFGRHEVPGVQHTKFETVLKFVANDEPVYLSGPAGSGKNVICKQVAEALGLDFYFTNAVTQEYKLTGFTDANGKFHESQFYKAFVNGGLFMLDEMDASIPEVLIILNAAIANRYFDFPAPIGKVNANPNFRVVAAGNTLGHGADSEYVGRNTLDAASLDRFAMIKIDYDERIEKNVAGGNDELVRFCRAFRKASEKAGLQVIVSYRAIGRMAKMVTLLPLEEVLDTCLVKGLERDDLKAVSNDLNGFGEYSDAFRKILERAC